MTIGNCWHLITAIERSPRPEWRDRVRKLPTECAKPDDCGDPRNCRKRGIDYLKTRADIVDRRRALG